MGCETLINQQDFLGVNLIAIQALEKRTSSINEEMDALKKEINFLKQQNLLLIKKLDKKNKP